ncbi:MAG: ABC transporter substrate-binding protein [Betaproteobacteria bacterium]|nr:ABC transporter substrate-binding protein [Betaproteobacteria bacterium]MDH5222762.1 ABC transporter substrate-binding protein [Betaproteobacteria bacterium]MDH5352720.1 ABC transporter substrate-binding protein [Betaproteobacteria bacterium]
MKELTPTGKLRVGVNLGNFLLVQRNADGSIRGIVPDLAQELARRLGVAAELRQYEKVGDVADGAKKGEWDVAFIGAEPQRAAEIDFTEPYVEIEACYLVPAGSPIKSIAEVDHQGVRIAVAARSAYHLWLERNIKHATLVVGDSIAGSYQRFVEEKLEVLAGLKPKLLEDASKLPGSRILEGNFTAVQQAIGTPKGRPEGAAYLREFAQDAKASGLVAQLIARHGIKGLSVAE